MAERRMFSKSVIDSDLFLDLPATSQLLYFHLAMRADDDGFCSSPKKIQRMIGASDDDVRLLCVKNFILPFESGVIVIRHWKLHNYIQKDRYKPTMYTTEMNQLSTDSSGVYSLDTPCIQSVSKMDTQVRLGKESLGQVRLGGGDGADAPPAPPAEKKKLSRFIPPTAGEVEAYCTEKHLQVDPERFVDFYESKGWVVGKAPMKSWQAAVRNWSKRDSLSGVPSTNTDYPHDLDDLF